MENFELCLYTRMIFGKSTENNIGDYVKAALSARGLAEDGKVLLVYGGGSIKRSGLYDRVCVSLTVAGLDYEELSGVQPNPTLEKVNEGIQLARAENIAFILAVGGGSVIDTAKAIAVGVPYEGDVWDFYVKKAAPAKALPVGVVLTLPAAGSEGSGNSVITNTAAKIKCGIRCPDILRPAFSVLNPELCRTLPREQMANGACDMFCHVMERYFSNSEHTALSDALCEGTFRTIIAAARTLAADITDYHAWAELMNCGTVAHNGILGAGRIEDWGSHALEHQLSANYPGIAHGAGLAAIAPAWLKYANQMNTGETARKRFRDFAVNVFGIAPGGNDDNALALAGIAAFEDFLRAIGLPTRLHELEINGGDLPAMAEAVAAARGPVGNFIKMTADDILAVYRLAE